MLVSYLKVFSMSPSLHTFCPWTLGVSDSRTKLQSPWGRSCPQPSLFMLRVGGIAPCVHMECVDSGLTTQELYKHTCTHLWQVFNKAQEKVLTVFHYWSADLTCSGTVSKARGEMLLQLLLLFQPLLTLLSAICLMLKFWFKGTEQNVLDWQHNWPKP